MEANPLRHGGYILSAARSWSAAYRLSGWLPSNPWAVLLFAVCIVALLCFVALPLAGTLWQSFRAVDGSYTLANYGAFFTSRRLYQAGINTVLVSTLAAIASVLIATPLAFGVTRTNMRGKPLVYIATVIMFASPGFLMTLAYVLLGGPNEGLANLLPRCGVAP